MKLFYLFFCMIFLGCGDDSQPSTQHSTTIAAQASESTQATAPEGATQSTKRVDGSILERHAQLGKDPMDAIALWLEAAILAQENNPEGWNALGHLTIPLKDTPNWRKSGANTYFVEAIEKKSPAFRSFIVGATPENGYKVDINNLQISLAYEGPKDVRGRKMMLNCSGSTMPRPIYVQQSSQSGLYYIKEYSSMYVDVKPVVDPNKEEFH